MAGGFESPLTDSEVGTDTNTDKDLGGVETRMNRRAIVSNNVDSGSSPPKGFVVHRFDSGVGLWWGEFP